MADELGAIRPTRRRVAGTLAALALVIAGAGCASDGLDAFTAPVGPPETRPPLPATTVAPASEPEQSGASEAGDEPEAPAPPATFAPNGEVEEVRALDNSFRVATIEITAGTEVLWLNGGRNDHDIFPVDDELGWGIADDEFTPGTEFRLVFDTPGVYGYYCSIHGTKEVGMVGTVIVTEP